MDESSTVWQSIRFGNGEAGAGDFRCDAEAFCETACKSSLAGANITDEFNDVRTIFGEVFAEF
jgi:hypothetical protein